MSEPKHHSETETVCRLAQAVNDFFVAREEGNHTKELISIDEMKQALDDFHRGSQS